MKSYRNIAGRDQFSGHWWITHKELGLSLEFWKCGRVTWELHGIYRSNGEFLESLITYVKLDKRNIVYPLYKMAIVPDFCTLKAAIAWVEWCNGTRILEEIK